MSATADPPHADATLPGMRSTMLLLTAVLVACFGLVACQADQAKLPLGDYATSSSPQVGKVFACNTKGDPSGGGAGTVGPWINESAKTWDKTKKLAIQGSVTWQSQ